MAIAVVLGTIAVVWFFCTFIMAVNVVKMTKDANGLVILTVDDGQVFTDSVSCVLYCKSRQKWNLQNSVRIEAYEGVGSNEAVRLGDLFMFNQIYPTDDRWQVVDQNGKTFFHYHAGPYYYQLTGRQETNNNANPAMHRGSK